MSARTTSSPLDPRIQFYLHRQQQTISSGAIGEKFASPSPPQPDMPVTAKVTDLTAWEALENIQFGVKIPLDRAQTQHIVTAKIPSVNAKWLSGLPYVSCLKLARTVYPLLRNTRLHLGLDTTFQNPKIPETGRGVVIGIVDYGADFAHEHFLTNERETRIRYIWDQSQAGIGVKDSPYNYGKIYTKVQINKALNQADPYQALNYHPGSESHGTHVMSIAAGSGRLDRTDAQGIAPEAELIFVETDSESTKSNKEKLETNFGDDKRIIEAVKYIFDQADDKPCIVNISLGTNGGPHDGTNPVEEAIDALVREKPGRAVVIAAGNSFEDRIHYNGRLTKGETQELAWTIPQSDDTPNEMEIWYSKGDEFSLQIFDEKEQLISRKFKLGHEGPIKKDRKELGYVIHKENDPENGDNVIHIFQDPSEIALETKWKVKITGEKVSNGTFHAWIERDDYKKDKNTQSTLSPYTTSYTLDSLSTGQLSISVSSYDTRRGSDKISWFSSAGPTRDKRKKPEISAPGSGILAAKSTTGQDLIEKNGTSMAAPVVTGVIALLFERALKYGERLPIEKTRSLLISTANKTSPKQWDKRYGYGKINLLGILEKYTPPKRVTSHSSEWAQPSPPSPVTLSTKEHLSLNPPFKPQPMTHSGHVTHKHQPRHNYTNSTTLPHRSEPSVLTFTLPQASETWITLNDGSVMTRLAFDTWIKNECTRRNYLNYPKYEALFKTYEPREFPTREDAIRHLFPDTPRRELVEHTPSCQTSCEIL